MEAEFDLVIYGASGFVGRLIAEHLARQRGKGTFRWAMAGRNLEKLRVIRDRIGGSGVSLIVANSDDPASLDAMVARTRAVLAAAGPFALHGGPVVAACARSGTDYLDVTGETVWTRQMIDAHEAEARASGARIIPCCGFDSVPSDLGVWLLQQRAREAFGRPVRRIKGRVLEIQGKFSGGTAETVRCLMAAAAQDPDFVTAMLDPFVLTPGFRGSPQPPLMEVRFDDGMRKWVGPFKMGPLNVANVHRSNLLQGHGYGEDFVYDEMMVFDGCGDADSAAAASARHGWSGLDMLAEENAPKPGEGPSRAERLAGHYELLYLGTDEGGHQIQVRVSGDEDAGYGSTAKIAAETALCLLEEGGDVPPGMWTPGAALKQKLIDRLSLNAGLTFTVTSG